MEGCLDWSSVPWHLWSQQHCSSAWLLLVLLAFADHVGGWYRLASHDYLRIQKPFLAAETSSQLLLAMWAPLRLCSEFRLSLSMGCVVAEAASHLGS